MKSVVVPPSGETWLFQLSEILECLGKLWQETPITWIQTPSISLPPNSSTSTATRGSNWSQFDSTKEMQHISTISCGTRSFCPLFAIIYSFASYEIHQFNINSTILASQIINFTNFSNLKYEWDHLGIHYSPLLTIILIIPVRSQWGCYNLSRVIDSLCPSYIPLHRHCCRLNLMKILFCAPFNPFELVKRCWNTMKSPLNPSFWVKMPWKSPWKSPWISPLAPRPSPGGRTFPFSRRRRTCGAPVVQAGRLWDRGAPAGWECGKHVRNIGC